MTISDYISVNVAFRKNVASSSLYGTSPPGFYTTVKCTDGEHHRGGCATRKEKPTWIRIDLVKQTTVVRVKIYQGQPTQHGSWRRMVDFGVNVGNNKNNYDGNEVCVPDNQDMTTVASKEFPCTAPITGYYVHLFIKKRAEVLDVGEIEVYGYTV